MNSLAKIVFHEKAGQYVHANPHATSTSVRHVSKPTSAGCVARCVVKKPTWLRVTTHNVWIDFVAEVVALPRRLIQEMNRSSVVMTVDHFNACNATKARFVLCCAVGGKTRRTWDTPICQLQQRALTCKDLKEPHLSAFHAMETFVFALGSVESCYSALQRIAEQLCVNIALKVPPTRIGWHVPRAVRSWWLTTQLGLFARIAVVFDEVRRMTRGSRNSSSKSRMLRLYYL